MLTDPASPSVGALPPDARFINRELSWLDFNDRVLAVAEDASLPVLERVKFVAIYGQNLDEFFQVRVAGLHEQLESGLAGTGPEGMTPTEQLQGIRERCVELGARADRLLTGDLLPTLEKAGVRLVSLDQLSAEDLGFVATEFRERIFPVLTPLSVDPAHPFPYISNLSLNLAVLVRDPLTGVRRFARVKVPRPLPRFLALPDGERFLLLEDALAANLDLLFPGMEVVRHHTFRVTRDADMDTEQDEAEDLLAAVESVLRRRRRSASPIRLEIDASTSTEVRELLLRELDLEPEDVYESRGLLDLSSLWGLFELDRPDLRRDPWTPVTQPRLANGSGAPDLFGVLRAGDVLVHHPYDSFATSVEAFIDQAASDPTVLAIKQTLYRTSSEESPIIRALIRAAETGKQVVVLVELTARFDEEANIAYARALEKAGAHVAYGVVGLKTHAKISLVVRRELGGVRRYVHIGTGNYNRVTAAIYEDLGLLSADPDLGADLSDLFNLLTGYSRQRDYRKLLVAPHSLRAGLTKLIRREAAADDGSIVLKMNSLVDPDMIDELYGASQAGTDIDLIIRGICCLRPGVEGLSERIRVRSIVGRYLEHSRIFRFGSPARGFDYLIGSADLMQRNLNRRVEAVTPVEDPALQERLAQILDEALADDVLAWQLGSDGTWTKLRSEFGRELHTRLQEIAVARARGERP